MMCSRMMTIGCPLPWKLCAWLRYQYNGRANLLDHVRIMRQAEPLKAANCTLQWQVTSASGSEASISSSVLADLRAVSVDDVRHFILLITVAW